MTPTQQAALEQVAREWLDSDNGIYSYNGSTISSLVTLLAAQRAKVLEEGIRAVDAEEELPGEMPDEMLKVLTSGDRELVEEALRCVVRATKKSITSRLKEQRP